MRMVNGMLMYWKSLSYRFASINLMHQPNPSPNPPPNLTREQLRGKFNERLFYWDLQINDALQNRPTVIPKAYLVGRTLAALRWCVGLQDQQLDDVLVEKVCQEY